MNFYLVGNLYIFVLFMLAILSDIEMDKCLHKKYNECDKGNYNKDGFHFSFTIYNPENIIPPIRLLLVVVKTEIGVACNHAKSLGSVRAFNRVGFIIFPIRVLKAEVGIALIISTLNIREVAHRAVMR